MTEEEEVNPFEGDGQKGARMAVKALKLLGMSDQSAGFSKLSGTKLESLVLWQQQQQRHEGLSPLSSWGLIKGVLTAFLPTVDIPGCPANDNPAARVRFIEKRIYTQQPSIPVRDFLDLGNFEACSNTARRVLQQLKNLIRQFDGQCTAPRGFPLVYDALCDILAKSLPSQTSKCSSMDDEESTSLTVASHDQSYFPGAKPSLSLDSQLVASVEVNALGSEDYLQVGLVPIVMLRIFVLVLILAVVAKAFI